MHGCLFDCLFVCVRLMQVPKPWFRSYVTSKNAMEQDLFVTNLTMAGVLDLWYKSFG